MTNGSNHFPHQQVRRTQRAIKHVLTERFYAWQEARQLASQDPEIDLTAVNKPAYKSEDVEVCFPMSYSLEQCPVVGVVVFSMMQLT